MSQDNQQNKQGVSRRRFIQGTGLGAVAVGTAAMGTTGLLHAKSNSGAIDSCKTPGCDYDVIVLGGGFAGVTAARELRQSGYKVLILEARNRLGGRTFNSLFEGHVVEFGGTWIHSTQPFVWAEKERYSLEVKDTPGAVPETMVTFVDGKTKQLTEAEIYEFVAAYQAYIAEARIILERPFETMYTGDKVLAAEKMSARDRLDQLDLNPTQYALMDGLLASMANGSSDELGYIAALRIFGMSGYDFMTMVDSVARYKLKYGTGHLLNKILEDGNPDVRLATPVKKVEDLGDKIQVTTARGETLTAAATVVTLPMNVLPKVEFSPALPQELHQAAAEKHAGTGFKVYMKVKGKLGKTFGMARSEAPLHFVMTYAEADDHTIMLGFGYNRDEIDPYDDESLQQSLRQYYPEAEVLSSYGYDWQLDPFSEGTWCMYKPGWLEKYYAHFNQDQGRVFFGQGDHGEGWRGTIDGAIGGGIKAAQRIKNRLKIS